MTPGGTGAIHAGFGGATLGPAFRDCKRRIADSVDVRAIVVRGENCTAALAVADLGLLWPSTCCRIRTALASQLKIPEAAVGVFTTQNHAVPYNDDPTTFDLDKLQEVFSSAVGAAADVQPVEVARVCAYPNPPLNLWRRVHLPEFGAFTYWYGWRVSPDGARADASELLKLTLAGLARGEGQLRCRQLTGNDAVDFNVPEAPLPVRAPFYADVAPDTAVQGLFFRTADANGAPVGSIVRFATHPATANHRNADYISGDYPAYVRRAAEKAFGGTSLFLTGPCGDSVAPVGIKSLDVARGLGERIAAAAVGQLSFAAWRRSGEVSVESPVVELPIRGDYPASRADAAQRAESIEAEIRTLAGDLAPLPRIKQLTDQAEMLRYVSSGAFQSWTGLDTETLRGKSIPHPFFFLRIADSVIAGLPGEPFGAYSVRMRHETIGDALIVAEEANGYLAYFPTAAEFPLGSYEPNAALFGPRCEDIMVNAVRTFF